MENYFVVHILLGYTIISTPLLSCLLVCCCGSCIFSYTRSLMRSNGLLNVPIVNSEECEHVNILSEYKYIAGVKNELVNNVNGNIMQIDESCTNCCICTCDYINGDILRYFNCNHNFHKKCIDEWLDVNPTCPLCRQDIFNTL